MGYISLPTWSLCIPRNGHVTTPSSLVQIYSHHDYDHPCHHGLYDDLSYSTSACHHFTFFALFLCLIVLWSRHYDSYDSHDPHIFLSFSHTAWSESRLTFIWLFISLTPLSPLTQPAPLSLYLFYFYLWCVISGVTLCHGHFSIYSVVAVWCSSLALIS